MTDAEIIDYATEFRREIVGNDSHRKCAMVCWPLQGLLECMGVACVCESMDFLEINHVVIRLADGRILDPTADQFGLKPVYLGKMPRKYQRWMREHAAFVTQARELLKVGCASVTNERSESSATLPSAAQK